MSNNFKIGDRVKLIRDACHAKAGMVGTIVHMSDRHIGVYFDKNFNGGHSCSGKCPYGYGHWVYAEDLDKIKGINHKIVITSDGKTTLARLHKNNKVIKKAEAICSPDDVFNFEIGAKLAFERLMEPHIPEEVVRDAVVGEYIKIVHAQMHSNYYKNGDIYRVIERNSAGVYFDIPNVTTSWTHGRGYAYDSEYVVLDGYAPEESDAGEPNKEKSEHEFKVGDRVRVIQDFHDVTEGMCGIIRHVDDDSLPYAVEFDKEFRGGHDCDCNIRKNHGYYVSESVIELCGPKFKVGDKVIANKKASGRYNITKAGWIGTVIGVYAESDDIEVKGPGICARSQEFRVNSEYFDLYESKGFNGKIVCTDDCGYHNFYTIGKIYNVIDGKFTSDNNDEFGPYVDLNDINEHNGAKFIEIKE